MKYKISVPLFQYNIGSHKPLGLAHYVVRVANYKQNMYFLFIGIFSSGNKCVDLCTPVHTKWCQNKTCKSTFTHCLLLHIIIHIVVFHNILTGEINLICHSCVDLKALMSFPQYDRNHRKYTAKTPVLNSTPGVVRGPHQVGVNFYTSRC